MIKKTIRYLRQKLTDAKVYTARAGSYIALFNSAMLILIFLKVEENAFLNEYKILLIIIWFTFLIFIGWFDVHIIKMLSNESETVFKYQPPIKRIHDGVQEILKRVEKIEEGLNENKNI